MRRLLPIVAIALAAAGCIELEQDYTLNPDGSGKVVVRWVASPMMELGGDKSPEARAKSLLKDEVAKSEGVDAWKDVSCQVRKDGKYEFRGTAYFRDFSALKLHNNGLVMLGLACSKDGAGNLVVTTRTEPAASAPKALTDEEAQKKLVEERVQYEQGKRFLEAMMGDLKVTTRLRLPGTLGAASNFMKEGDSTIRITLEGKVFFKALDELIKDDAWMLRTVRSGGLQAAPTPDEAFVAKVFGEKGPVRAVTSGPLKPAFDYEPEASAARKAWEETLAAMEPAAGPPAKGEGFTSLRVAGIRYDYENREGVKVSLVGDLSGVALHAKEGRLVSATADTGRSLLPEREFDRPIRFPKLGEDRKSIAFDVTLGLPPAGAKGFKEISGTLSYTVGGKTKDVDLGITELKAGAKGKGAAVTKVEDSAWEEGHQTLDVKIEMSNDLIASIVVEDESGRPLPAKPSGYSATNDQVTRSLSLKGKFPPKGKIILKVYDDLKTFEIPFKLENLDLLGRPLK
jgi:hypothetical protein